jgi:hypothetical protein
MKITKRQLKQIIKEERAKLAEQAPAPRTFGMHDPDYWFDLFTEEVENFIDTDGRWPSSLDMRDMRAALMAAMDRIEAEYE